MDSILSSVLSIFSHNPIFVLGIIAYIAFSIIKSKNTEESDDYDNYESSSSGQTWEAVSYTHLTLPTTSRRQRQMCIRDRTMKVQVRLGRIWSVNMVSP